MYTGEVAQVRTSISIRMYIVARLELLSGRWFGQGSCGHVDQIAVHESLNTKPLDEKRRCIIYAISRNHASLSDRGIASTSIGSTISIVRKWKAEIRVVERRGARNKPPFHSEYKSSSKCGKIELNRRSCSRDGNRLSAILGLIYYRLTRERVNCYCM